MIIIQDSNRSPVTNQISTEGIRTGIHKANSNPPLLGFLWSDSQFRLSIFAPLEGGGIVGGSRVFGANFLMPRKFLRRLVSSAGALIKPAELVMTRRMLRFELR